MRVVENSRDKRTLCPTKLYTHKFVKFMELSIIYRSFYNEIIIPFRCISF